MSGSIPRNGRPLTCAQNNKGIVFVYGGYDGENPLRSLLEYHIKGNIFSFFFFQS